MKVFISWSGSTSRLIAEAFSDWLPKVIQGVEPFVSAKDIDKGSNWTVELARELETAEFGIVCLAPDNLLSPWLNYETGAITRSVDSRVCPVLFNVAKAEVKPPMAQLQLTLLEKEEIYLMMISINKASGGSLRAESVREAVDVWWPKLETVLSGISVPRGPSSGAESTPEPAKPAIDVAEMMEELLHRVRNLDDRVRRQGASGGSGLTASGTRGPARFKAAREHLELMADLAGLVIEKTRTHSGGIDLYFRETIADPVPAEIVDAGMTVARAEQVSIRFFSPDRVLSFDKSGEMTELPF